MFIEVLFYSPSPWCSCFYITWYGGRPESLHQFLLGQMFFVLLATVVLLSHDWVVEGSLTDGAEAVRVMNSRALSFSGLYIHLFHWNNGLRNGCDGNHTRTYHTYIHIYISFPEKLKYEDFNDNHIHTRCLYSEAFQSKILGMHFALVVRLSHHCRWKAHVAHVAGFVFLPFTLYNLATLPEMKQDANELKTYKWQLKSRGII